MTYPPQQPGPYGQQPQQPGGYGQQPDPWAQPQPQPTTQYQGLGGFPGAGGGPPPPPKKSNVGQIVAIVLIALLLLGGAGVGVYFLNKDGEPSATGGGETTTTRKNSPTTSESPSETTETTSERESTSQRPPDGPSTTGSAPREIVDAYVDAYKTKSFSSVTNGACEAYKKKYGTDTTELETKLSEFDITATAQGEPEVKGTTATAKIDLTLSKGTESKDASIKIKIVKESGEWRFCGEEAA
ncbi:MAG: hypothetical protein M3548_23025 [Actinomycetota bacterium]|nr:hypothetical protein [Actinomycetota bacterium]